MDRVEQLLRAELERVASWPQPDPDRVLARVHRRRRWGRALLAGFAVAVTAGAGGGALVAARPGPGPEPLPSRPERPAGAVVVDAYVVDARIVVALARQCGAAGDPCTFWLTSTHDGGASWAMRPAPVTGSLDQGTAFPRLHAWDERRVVIDYRPGERSDRWFSPDGGVTWEKRSRAPNSTVDRVPARSRLSIEPMRLTGSPLVVLQPDGSSAWLAGMPRPSAWLSATFTDAVAATDGSLWLRGGDDTGTVLVVSRDRGMSWSEVAQPAGANGPAAGPSVDWFAIADGRTGYLYDNQRRLWRMVDGGRSWQRIPLPDGLAENAPYGVATSDGGLILELEAGRLFTVASTGDRPEPAPADWPVRTVGRAGAGCYGSSTTNVYVSADCRTWTPLWR